MAAYYRFDAGSNNLITSDVLGGESVTVNVPGGTEIAYRYILSGGSMTVHLYNDKRVGSRAMGKWWITVNGANVVMKVSRN